MGTELGISPNSWLQLMLNLGPVWQTQSLRILIRDHCSPCDGTEPTARKWGDSPEPPPPYPIQKHGSTLVLRLLREDTVEALLARLRLLRGRPCSIESLGEKEKGVCVSPLMEAEDRVVGSWLKGQRSLRRKKLLFGD